MPRDGALSNSRVVGASFTSRLRAFARLMKLTSERLSTAQTPEEAMSSWAGTLNGA